MALSASIYKVNVSLSNLNTHYYEDFKLTLAKHPSENESRMIFRLLAFLYAAHPDLAFTKGLSNTEEPELWQKNSCGDILHWIELGQPDDKRIKQACGKAQKVTVFTYHPRKAMEWHDKNRQNFNGNKKLNIVHLEVTSEISPESIVEKNMHLSCVIEDSQMSLSSDDSTLQITVTT